MCTKGSISVSDAINALFLVAPQFYTTDQDKLVLYERMAELIRCQINFRMLSCCGVMIYAFLLAHYLTLQTQPSVGVASAMKEGDLSINFNVSVDMDALLLTPYGRSYLDLVRRTVSGDTVTNLPVALGGVYQYIPTWGCGGYGWGSGFGQGYGGGCC